MVIRRLFSTLFLPTTSFMKKSAILLSLLFSLSTFGWSQTQEKSLFVLGSSGAGVIFNTYQYLDLLYEGLLVECTTSEMVSNASQGQVGLLEVIQNGYQELLDSGELTDPSDQMYVQRLVEITGLLKEQASYLNSYSLNSDEKSSESFVKTREAAWVRISDLLQLDSN